MEKIPLLMVLVLLKKKFVDSHLLLLKVRKFSLLYLKIAKREGSWLAIRALEFYYSDIFSQQYGYAP